MVWSVLCHLFSCLVDLFTLRPLTDAQKDIQILLLRQQLHVLQRKARQPKRFSRLEKTLLAVLVAKLRDERLPRSNSTRVDLQLGHRTALAS
jgi:hypothetical protein